MQTELRIVPQTNSWPPELKQPWACFTPLGHRLNTAAEIIQAKDVFILIRRFRRRIVAIILPLEQIYTIAYVIKKIVRLLFVHYRIN